MNFTQMILHYPFKPNTQIILITQDPLEQLHFDIRNNRVINYNPDGNVAKIKGAFLSAAQAFESERSRYVTQISKSMSTDAIRTLHCYAGWYQDENSARSQPGLFASERMPPFFNDYKEQALNMFQLALLELLEKRMIWTDYSTKLDDKGVEIHGWATHATKLGWLVIKHLWPHYTEKYCQRIN